ncbi:Serine hydroxymethyltransferase, cytosolic [Podila verticillata]|nr:Serine hydroxymethyltransferase, cytosolic [Podila verticillata]
MAQVDSWNSAMNTTLEVEDPEIYKLIKQEQYRQYSGLELIASENFTSQAVMEANGSALTNKYSEGLPGARYYGGNEYIDVIENLCRKRALDAFGLSAEEWGVNVQPYSGSTANFAALTAMIQPQDRIMGLDLPSGGHLTHGYQTAKKKISATSIYFQSMPYQVSTTTGLIDLDRLEENAKLFRPKVLICGASAYPREWDYARFRKIADQHGAYLMCDMAHISGLVAGQEAESPFKYCDVGEDLESRVNQAVFPSIQGGPHNNTIAAIAVALKQAASPEFKLYAKQVIANSKALAANLISHGYKIQTDGSDNHLILWDLRPLKLTGSKVERICDIAQITLNKNSVCGDVSAVTPGGVRLGTSALTSRSFKEADFVKVGEFLHRIVQIALSVQAKAGSKLMKDFVATLEGDVEVATLRKEVEAFATSFPFPGFNPEECKAYAPKH